MGAQHHHNRPGGRGEDGIHRAPQERAAVKPEQLPALLETELKVLENEHHAPLGVLTKTAEMAHVVFPSSAAWCESEGTVTSMATPSTGMLAAEMAMSWSTARAER